MQVSDFDKVYVIHLSDRRDRMNNIENEFKKVSLSDKLDIKWVCHYDMANAKSIACFPGFWNAFNGAGKYDTVKARARAYGTTISHFELIKTPYERGFDHIMIFEDDIKFNCDEEFFKKILDIIPSDYKVCMLGWGGTGAGVHVADANTNINFFNWPNKLRFELGAYAYCISRKGMKQIIDILEKDCCCIDAVYDVNKGWEERDGKLDGFYVLQPGNIISHGHLESSILS